MMMAARSLHPPSERRRKDTNYDLNAFPGPKMQILEKLSHVVVFTHGVEAPSISEWMIRWKKILLATRLHALEVDTCES
ncbi:hypothetical protein V2J09_003700 [Rumex salicifolius]